MNESTESPESLEELRDAAFSHPGFSIKEVMRQLEEPYGLVLWPNAFEMNRHLSMFPLDAQGNYLFDMRNDALMDGYIREVTRLVHNLVASVGTTIDHTRRVIMEAYPEPSNPIRIINRQSARNFQENGELLFVQDLRNYTLHRALPPLLANLHFGKDVGLDHTITLKVATLLEWDRWDPAVKQYLQSCETIELRPTVLKYVEAATQLLRTVLEAISTEYAEELRDFDVLAERHDVLVSFFREQWFSQIPKPADPATSSNESN